MSSTIDSRNSRRDFIRLALAGGAALMPERAFASAQTQARTTRRFVIDAHQHYASAPDYIDRVVQTYRPRNAMACVLTPMSGFETVKKAAGQYPDVIIPYGSISVD